MNVPAPSPLEFPCTLDVKVFGLAEEDFADHVTALIRQHDPHVDRDRVRLQPSREGRWVSVTVPVRATSREHLEALSQTLRDDPRVKASF